MPPKAEGARSVPEIRQAIALFEAWEARVNELAAARGFTEAVQVLDDYLECEPETPHREFIRNLKVSNTRRLLQQLAKVERRDFSLWLEYAVSAVAAVSSEAESVMNANPGLRADYASFLEAWGGAVTDALQRIQKGEG